MERYDTKNGERITYDIFELSEREWNQYVTSMNKRKNRESPEILAILKGDPNEDS